MVGLLDIGPATAKVTIRGHIVTVKGVSAADVFELLQAFPEFQALLGSRDPNLQLTPARIIEMLPDAGAAIIAYGIVDGDRADNARVAEQLVIEEQLDLLEAIIALTMPSGFGPFVARLAKMGLFADGEFGKASAGKSPLQSQPVSSEATG